MWTISTCFTTDKQSSSGNIQEILQIFGEAMEIYRETMKAIGQEVPARIFSGDTSTIEFQQTSSSTIELQFKNHELSKTS